MKIINYSNLRDNMKTYMDAASDYEIIVITRKGGNVVMISEEMYNEMKSSNYNNASSVSEAPMGYSTIQPGVYKQAQEILTELGTSVDAAFNMFLKQVILQRGIPFEVKFPEEITDFSNQEILLYLEKSMEKLDKSSEEYKKLLAQFNLIHELEEGRKSGETQGYVASEDVRKYFAGKRK